MKRRFVFIIFIMLGVLLTSCNNNEKQNEQQIDKHYHDVSLEWDYDEKMHWNVCSCGDIINKSNHTYVNGICAICDYAKSPLLYNLLDDDTYEVYVNTNSYLEIIIPNTFRGKPVTSIAEEGFMECINLESITIPSSIKKIGNRAFSECKNLKNIKIEKGVTNIGEYAFYGCISLENIVLLEGLTTISSFAFDECINLTSITLPSTLTSIENYAFKNCYRLVEIFNLSQLDISKKSYDYGYIGLNAKIIHNKLEESNLIKKDDYIFLYNDNEYNLVLYRGNDTIITLPEDINGFSYKINEYAFYDNDSLLSITLPNGLIDIGNLAFYNCYRLVVVYNLSSLNIIVGTNDYGFVGYYARVIHNNLDESNLIIKDDYVFLYENNEYFLIIYNGDATKITLPTNINDNSYKIYDSAFYKNKAITSVIIPEGVTSIGKSAFYDCYNLCNLTISSTVKSIEDNAFSHCYNIRELIIPEGVTTIGNNAFENCDSIKYVLIPSSLTSIGDSAFEFCRRIENVYYKGSISDWYNIEIKPFNMEYLSNGNICFYSEDEPLDTTNKYWHYVDNKIVIWE